MTIKSTSSWWLFLHDCARAHDCRAGREIACCHEKATRGLVFSERFCMRGNCFRLRVGLTMSRKPLSAWRNCLMHSKNVLAISIRPSSRVHRGTESAKNHSNVNHFLPLRHSPFVAHTKISLGVFCLFFLIPRTALAIYKWLSRGKKWQRTTRKSEISSLEFLRSGGRFLLCKSSGRWRRSFIIIFCLTPITS